MRLVLAVVLAGLVALPLSVSAQAGEESTEPNVEEPAPPSEPAPEEPPPSLEPTPEESALQLELDAAGVEVVPTPPRTADGYTLEEMELRVKRAKIGLITSGGVFAAGVVLGALGLFGGDCYSFVNPKNTWCDPLAYTGAVLTAGGIIGVIATGAMHGTRKTERDKLKRAWHERQRRVQWDLARSQLVF